MSFTVALYWNDFLGFHGPPVTGATFEAITYPGNGKTPVYTPLTASSTGVSGNIFNVEREAAYGEVRYTGWHPTTRENRVNTARADNGGGYTWVV